MTAAQVTFGGITYRVRDGIAERREQGAWRLLTRSELLALPAKSVAWQWLREHGVKRPTKSGTRGMSDAGRSTVLCALRLAPEEVERLKRRAERARKNVSRYVADELELERE